MVGTNDTSNWVLFHCCVLIGSSCIPIPLPTHSCLQELKHAEEELVRMEDERSHTEPKLRRADQLQNEVNTLSCELQVLGELYQQQREEAQELRMHSQREQELGLLCNSLIKEKEATQKTITSLNQQLQVSLARSWELEEIVSQREEELASLQQKLNSAQGRHQAKMKVSDCRECHLNPPPLLPLPLAVANHLFVVEVDGVYVTTIYYYCVCRVHVIYQWVDCVVVSVQVDST